MQKQPTGDLCPTCGQPTIQNKVEVLLDSLPPRAFVRQKLLMQLVPFSPATLWRKVASGDFPKPVKLSDRVTGWRVEDIREWFAQKGIV